MTRLGQKLQAKTAWEKSTPLAADFVKSEFDTMFRDKGYNVIVERAIMCPCKSQAADHLSSCKNCGGSGWVFVNPFSTRLIMTGMSLDKDYDETARKDIGIVNVTARPEDDIAFMDKIVMVDTLVTHHEVLFPSLDSTFYKASTFYDIDSIIFLGQFVGNATTLRRLTFGTDYTWANNVLEFSPTFHLVTGTASIAGSSTQLTNATGSFLTKGIQKGDVIKNLTDGSQSTVVSFTATTIMMNALTGGTLNVWSDADAYEITIKPQVSLRYKHKPVFYIWDAPRQAITTLLVKGSTKRVPIPLAVKAIAKRAHLIAEAENWTGNRLLDNSWLDTCPPEALTAAQNIVRNSTAQFIFDNLTQTQKNDLNDLLNP